MIWEYSTQISIFFFLVTLFTAPTALIYYLKITYPGEKINIQKMSFVVSISFLASVVAAILWPIILIVASVAVIIYGVSYILVKVVN